MYHTIGFYVSNFPMDNPQQNWQAKSEEDKTRAGQSRWGSYRNAPAKQEKNFAQDPSLDWNLNMSMKIKTSFVSFRAGSYQREPEVK